MSAAVPSAVASLTTFIEATLVTGRWDAVLLFSLRVAAVLFMTPVLYAAPIPPVARMLLVLTLSIALAAGLMPAEHQQLVPGQLWQSAASELVLGATLGLGILLAFAAFSIAGSILDAQIGFGIAQLLDPVTRRPVPVLTSVFQYLAILVFFLINGHHALLRGLAYSVQHFPVGERWSLAVAVGPVIKQAAGLFSLGFALAAPVVFCVLLVEFALGVIARNLPQMNMFTMGFPVKIIVGLAALSLWFSGIGAVMTRTYGGIASTWDDMFRAAAAAKADPKGRVR